MVFSRLRECEYSLLKISNSWGHHTWLKQITMQIKNQMVCSGKREWFLKGDNVFG